MDNALIALLSTQFIFFGLMIAALTWMARIIVEYLMKNGELATSNVWLEVILPIFPIPLGGLIGFVAKMYPYPPGIFSASGRISFGLVAGLVSTLLYRVVKSVLKAKITDGSKDDSLPGE